VRHEVAHAVADGRHRHPQVRNVLRGKYTEDRSYKQCRRYAGLEVSSSANKYEVARVSHLWIRLHDVLLPVDVVVEEHGGVLHQPGLHRRHACFVPGLGLRAPR